MTIEQKSSNASAESEDVAVELSTPAVRTAEGPTPITVTVQNHNGRPIRIDERFGVPIGMQLKLVDDSGRTVDMTPTGKNLLDRVKKGGSMRISSLAKGDKGTLTFDLNDFFDVKAGKYKLNATFRFGRVPSVAGQAEYLEVRVHDLVFSCSK